MEYIIQLPEKGFIQGQIFEHLQVWASLVAQLVKNPPAMQETWVRSLCWEDSLEKGTLPTPLFWPGEFHGLYSPWGCKELDTRDQKIVASLHT